jgi:hypothetical protein
VRGSCTAGKREQRKGKHSATERLGEFDCRLEDVGGEAVGEKFRREMAPCQFRALFFLFAFHCMRAASPFPFPFLFYSSSSSSSSFAAFFPSTSSRPHVPPPPPPPASALQPPRVNDVGTSACVRVCFFYGLWNDPRRGFMPPNATLCSFKLWLDEACAYIIQSTGQIGDLFTIIDCRC